MRVRGKREEREFRLTLTFADWIRGGRTTTNHKCNSYGNGLVTVTATATATATATVTVTVKLRVRNRFMVEVRVRERVRVRTRQVCLENRFRHSGRRSRV